MPTTATKREKKHSKAGRSPSVPTTTTKRKNNTPERAEAPKSRKTNTNPKPQPPKGGRRTPQGRQESQSAKRQTPITTTKGSRQPRAGRSPRAPINKHRPQPPNQTNPRAGRSHRASKEKRQQQRPATKDNCQPRPPRRRERGGKTAETKNKKTPFCLQKLPSHRIQLLQPGLYFSVRLLHHSHQSCVARSSSLCIAVESCQFAQRGNCCSCT